ncbi:Epithelial discoidin domain-containing receptor 1 [Bagarius yarrelli]|uniref:receptor protein-tyrosine kinase n=1 Tax=Bagarius yarrelli TaxID=175774 RepID=A0A556VA03_BAGYA|nr:Epithelial discoidin domain-containing receptor 1 [Bagarius yarrelli]
MATWLQPMLRLFLGTLLLSPIKAQDHEWHFDTTTCRYALGMEDGTIPDSDISASSAWSDSTEAKHGRLSTGEGDGAWCPLGPVFPNPSEYLQVDLHKLYFLSLVGTQGRHADGHGREFARSYRLKYSRDGRQWITWRDRWGKDVILGNENTYEVVLKDLGPPIIARMVRFYPLADRMMSVCLRVELYGCLWSDGLKAYTAPMGHIMQLSGSPVYLNDSIYDGSVEAGMLFGGLGQLCDGVLGGDDFMESKELRVWPGYDYVGWNREALGKPTVDIEFHFEKPRLFHTMQVHSNNMHTQGVRVFSEVLCQFKASLLSPWKPFDTSSPIPSEALTPPSLTSRSPPLLTSPPVTSSIFPSTSNSSRRQTGDAGEEFSDITPRPGLPVAKDDSSNTAILIGCLVGIILLLLAVIVGILWRQYWKKLLGKAQGSLSSDELRVHLSVPTENVVINNTNTHTYSSRYQRIHTFPDDPEREGEYQEPSMVVRPREQRDSTACSVDMDNKALPVQEGPPPYPGAPPPLLGAHYAEATGGGPSVPHYAEADIISLQGVSGNNTYAVPALSATPTECPPLPELQRERLLFKEKLGEGQFGEVHLCEIENPQDLPNLEFPFNVRKGRPLLVAVKILRPDASKNARNDFLKEVKILSRLKDPNIIRLLGVCVSSDPLCMVTEYMESGDLNQYLSQRVLLDKTGPLHNMPTISYPALISMASQIASGMKFLASLNFVHRDLATRNCLVGGERGEEDDRTGERHIKIADFGMSRNLYAGDYYRIQGRAVLPIRWMAWECILMGKFTTASDVWAFGVTLWEMLSVCQEQPYGHMTDEQVIDNAGEFFRDQGRQVYLTRPAVCPQGLYELMLSCWNRDCKLRPSFTQIHSFLTEDAMNMV